MNEEKSIDSGGNASSSDLPNTDSNVSSQDNNAASDAEDGTGYNSEDEYSSSVTPFKSQNLTEEDWSAVCFYIAQLHEVYLKSKGRSVERKCNC